MNINEERKIATSVSIKTIIVTAILTILKVIAGFLSNSTAMISDAIHSASDVFSTIIVMAGVYISRKEGKTLKNRKIESFIAIFISLILIFTSLGTGYAAFSKILNQNINYISSGNIALVVAILSIFVREWMFQYTKKAAKEIDSEALMADAVHHRSDSLASLGTLIGVLGSKLGFPILDPIAAIIMCLLIIKSSSEVLIDSIKKLTDEDYVSNLHDHHH